MITVIITTHLELDRHLRRCLDSVLWQLVPDEDECLVIGDGYDPGDEVLTILGYTPRLRLRFLHQPKTGVSTARNLGIREAQGEWIKFLDVDDVLMPFALGGFRHLIKVSDTMALPQLAVVSGIYMRVHNGLPNDFAAFDPKLIRQQNPMMVSPTFVRTAAARAVEGFDPRIDFEEDWDFWLRLQTAGYSFATIGFPVCAYTINDEERAAKVRNCQVEGVNVREFLRKKYNLPDPKKEP